MLRMFDNIRDFGKSSAEVKRFKPDVILDDYIQLITCDGYNNERRLQIEEAKVRSLTLKSRVSARLINHPRLFKIAYFFFWRLRLLYKIFKRYEN